MLLDVRETYEENKDGTQHDYLVVFQEDILN